MPTLRPGRPIAGTHCSRELGARLSLPACGNRSRAHPWNGSRERLRGSGEPFRRRSREPFPSGRVRRLARLRTQVGVLLLGQHEGRRADAAVGGHRGPS